MVGGSRDQKVGVKGKRGMDGEGKRKAQIRMDQVVRNLVCRHQEEERGLLKSESRGKVVAGNETEGEREQ